MTFSFEPDLSTATSKVRQFLGDTVEAKKLVEDETIQFYLDQNTNERLVAAQLARDLVARFSADVDSDFDGQGEKLSQRVKHFTDLAIRLEREGSRVAGAPGAAAGGFSGLFVGGATSQEVMDARCDPSRAANVPLRITPRW